MKKKAFGYRVIVIGLMVSLIADSAWAMIMVTINPASGSMRKKTDGVNGHGTIMVMGESGKG